MDNRSLILTDQTCQHSDRTGSNLAQRQALFLHPLEINIKCCYQRSDRTVFCCSTRVPICNEAHSFVVFIRQCQVLHICYRFPGSSLDWLFQQVLLKQESRAIMASSHCNSKI